MVDAANVRRAAGRASRTGTGQPERRRREEQEQRHRRRPEIARRVQPVRGPERHEGVPELSRLESEPPHRVGGNEASRLAVVERLERLLRQAGVAGPELGVAELEVRVGGEISVADRLAVVANPEVHPAGRGDRDELPMDDGVAYGPRRDRDERQGDEEEGAARSSAAIRRAPRTTAAPPAGGRTAAPGGSARRHRRRGRRPRSRAWSRRGRHGRRAFHRSRRRARRHNPTPGSRQLLAQGVGRHPDQRREQRGEPGGSGGGAVAGDAAHQGRQHENRRRAEDRPGQSSPRPARRPGAVRREGRRPATSAAPGRGDSPARGRSVGCCSLATARRREARGRSRGPARRCLLATPPSAASRVAPGPRPLRRRRWARRRSRGGDRRLGRTNQWRSRGPARR